MSDNLFPDATQVVDNPIYTPPNKQTTYVKESYIPEELELRKEFVKEYIKDNNAVGALMRCGLQYSYAVTTAPRILAESLVQKLIHDELEAQKLIKPDDFNSEIRQEIIGELRAVLGDPTTMPGEKIKAGKELAALLGLSAPAKSEITTNHTGGVMIQPVFTGTSDEWESHAIQSQRELKRTVVTDID